MPELLTDVLAEHTYDPVGSYRQSSPCANPDVDSYIYDSAPVRKQLPKDTSRYMARRLEEV